MQVKHLEQCLAHILSVLTTDAAAANVTGDALARV
jgi:hypothetical protein